MAKTKEKPDLTAIGVAAIRTMEAYYPPELRLFEDEVSKHMVPRFHQFFLGTMRSKRLRNWAQQRRDREYPGALGLIPTRTRYIDDIVAKALAEGVRQIVILGAGVDTRPYRIPGIQEATVYEIDRPVTLEYKKARVQKHFGKLPQHVRYIATDFNSQPLEEVLNATELVMPAPVLFIWEGVTQYITAEAVSDTLNCIHSYTQASLVFSYAPRDVVEGTANVHNLKRFLEAFKKSGVPWTWGINPQDLGDFLARHGLSLQEDVGNEEYQERYLKPIGRQLMVSSMERVAYATL